jgi:hypothetical protein
LETSNPKLSKDIKNGLDLLHKINPLQGAQNLAICDKYGNVPSPLLEGEYVQHEFERYVPIRGMNKDTIQCDMHNDGHLCICAQREFFAEPRKIPINFKQPKQQQKTQTKVKLEIRPSLMNN